MNHFNADRKVVARVKESYDTQFRFSFIPIVLTVYINVHQISILKAIEKTSALTSSFKPTRPTAICGECGFKDEPFDDKCPKCKSPYVV